MRHAGTAETGVPFFYFDVPEMRDVHGKKIKIANVHPTVARQYPVRQKNRGGHGSPLLQGVPWECAGVLCGMPEFTRLRPHAAGPLSPGKEKNHLREMPHPLLPPPGTRRYAPRHERGRAPDVSTPSVAYPLAHVAKPPGKTPLALIFFGSSIKLTELGFF
jgi:hypothetical protein